MRTIGFSIDDLKNISVIQALGLIKLHNKIKSQEVQLLDQKNKVKQASQKDINSLFS